MKEKKSSKLLVILLCISILMQMQGNICAETYKYENGRLKEIIYDDGIVNFTYDKNGNVLSKTTNGFGKVLIEVTDAYIEKIEVKDGLCNYLFFYYPDDVQKYEIYRKEESMDDFLKIGETSAHKYKDNTVETGRSYVYKVKPVFVGGTENDEEYSLEILAKSYNKLQNVSFEINSCLGNNIEIGVNDKLTNISLVWDVEEDASYYQVKESSTNSCRTIQVGGNCFIDENLVDSQFAYQVRTCVERENSTIFSPYTSRISFSETFPVAPADVRSGTNEIGQKCIFWTPQDQCTNFVIYQSSFEEGPYNFYSAKINSKVNSCVCKGDYFYCVVSYKIVNGKMIISKLSDYTWV